MCERRVHVCVNGTESKRCDDQVLDGRTENPWKPCVSWEYTHV